MEVIQHKILKRAWKQRHEGSSWNTEEQRNIYLTQVEEEKKREEIGVRDPLMGKKRSSYYLTVSKSKPNTEHAKMLMCLKKKAQFCLIIL